MFRSAPATSGILGRPWWMGTLSLLTFTAGLKTLLSSHHEPTYTYLLISHLFVGFIPCASAGQPWEMALSISSWFRVAFNFIHFKQQFSLSGLFISMVVCWLTLRSRWRRTERNQMMSPDTVSSLFPDRPIRPLPKRRLRERLSPEAADAIKYPQLTQGNAPLFHYPPYTLKEESGQLSGGGPLEPTQPAWFDAAARALASQRDKAQSRAGEEAYPGIRSTLVTRSPPEILNRTGRQSGRPEQPRRVEAQPPLSANSSVDGYDSFENTNNKKKRKIPSAGESSINGSHGLSSDINALGLSSAVLPTVEDATHGIDRIYHGSNGYPAPTSYAPGSQGFSGPGRGRLGRSTNGRSPLRALPDGNTSWPGRGAKTGGTHWAPGIFTPFFSLIKCLHGPSIRQLIAASGWTM